MAYEVCTRGIGTHQVIAREVAAGTSVLDVGCSTGFLMAMLRSRGCRPVGVEYDTAAAAEAAAQGFEVHVGDAAVILPRLPTAAFDHVVFGDVLEHLTDPRAVLAASVPLLRPGGSVIVSLPNVAFLLNRLGLLLGRWEYRDRGILDRTHLRFFTRRTAQALLCDAGFEVTGASATGPLSYRLAGAGERITELWPSGLGVNVILTGVPNGTADGPSPRG